MLYLKIKCLFCPGKQKNLIHFLFFSGCIPLLVQLVHSECDALTRQQASQALHNLVQAQPDERLLRRETRVLKLLEQIRIYCENVVDEKTPDTPSTSEISSDKGLYINLKYLRILF